MKTYCCTFSIFQYNRYMMRDLVSYVRFIHGYLFMIVLGAFLLYVSGNVWLIDEEHLIVMLTVSSTGGILYLIMSVLIILMLIYRKIRYVRIPFWGPLMITLLCSAAAGAAYVLSEGTLIVIQQ